MLVNVLFRLDAIPRVTVKLESVPPAPICDGVNDTTTLSPDVFALAVLPVRIWPTPVAVSV